VRQRHLTARVMVAALAAALLALAGCGGGSEEAASTDKPAEQPAELTVWLMNGSQPDTVVKSVNAEFAKTYPNTKVKVELQQWDGIQEKTTAALAGNSPPDVLEIGNTLTAKFAASGGLLDLTDKKTDLGGGSWLKGLEESGTYEGKLFGVPYYAGNRGVIYRKDFFAKAGITELPTDRASFDAAAAKLMGAYGSDRAFSALYFPGKYWYAALPFIWDEGGDLAVKDGDTWKGSLDSPQAQAGLTYLKGIVDKYSRAPKDGDETTDKDAFGQGKAGMIIDPGWMVGVITGEHPELKKQIGVFPIPGKTAGQTAPVFLGGSTLSVAAGTDAPDAAYDWLKILAGKQIQTQLATEGGVIPNSVDLLDVHKSDPILSVFDQAAKNSRFTPTTPNWANVESSTILQDMLVQIFTGKASVADATKSASTAITDKLNA
jgi:N,N'-diacetylchitobiose transport system substrate-binding protein